MRTLVIGSLGWGAHPDIVRVDYIPEWADVCCDIGKGIPLTEEFDVIDCKHILEHIQLNTEYKLIWWELHRLLKVGGKLNISVPHKDTQMAYESWDHCRYFVNNSFIAFYGNPNHVVEGLPKFKLLKLYNGIINGEKTIEITLTK
jgi:hypothetical protein